ncbi:hypothetical protein [Shewanella subflava]|uniref:Uncharacterized protein n=1 Tax=Shewanella subflava TaxID=2986476 RepID=A0ABT3IAH2_9GAMM|nr:hypothetical protein [Shewanella subflava]MCW3172868.1 hypothetical protein [Shewanella subflava]
MDVASYQFQEQRKHCFSNLEHWDNASAEQKITLYKLHNYGYRLLFIRHTTAGPLAVISQDNDIAVIDADGALNLQHQIKLRHNPAE